MDTASLISAAVNQGGFDTSRTTVLGIVNERYQELVAESRWLRESVELGPTVNGTDTYTVPDNLIEIYRLKVGSYRFEPIGIDQMWDIQASQIMVFAGRGGVFATQYTSSGGTQVQLYPVPTADGDSITAYAAVLPDDLADLNTSVPAIPVDFHSALLDGTIATLLLRYDERADLAAPYQQSFQSAKEQLRRRKNSRIGSGSPAQILIEGVHWR